MPSPRVNAENPALFQGNNATRNAALLSSSIGL